MRSLGVLTGALILSAVLSACGSTAYSYSQGLRAGQSIAANGQREAFNASRAAAACRHDWPVAGSVGISRRPWLRGCVAGFRLVDAAVGQP